eukprot:g6033.t1
MSNNTKTKLSYSSISSNLKNAQYAVRGRVLDLAFEIKKELDSGKSKLPFKKLYHCNIGNPQKLGQKPLKFNREVLSLVTNPSLMEHKSIFSEQARARAKQYLNAIQGGVGAYSQSQGFEIVRKEVASFISKRDGFPSNPNNIFLSEGASSSVRMIYQTIIASDSDGIMVPIPQYPLYSALSTLMGANLVGYYLDETAGWKAHMSELMRSYEEAIKNGTRVRALVVINPGNPTGQCLSLSAQQDLVRFCVKNSLVLLADEVYQENVYAKDKTFTSFKKVALSMGKEMSELQLVSFHSTSKGFIGECGLRGGYMELHNIPEDVKAQIKKLASISLCPNTIGQLCVGLMTNPPTSGEAGKEYEKQSSETLASMERRAIKLCKGLNDLEGVTCNRAEGAMYLFPRIRLPEAVTKAAKEQGMSVDNFYCCEALRHTGIVVVPGSGFKQEPGTFHFRTTFLPSEDDMESVIESLSTFHADFIKKFHH